MSVEEKRAIELRDAEAAPLSEDEQKVWDHLHTELKDLIPEDVDRAMIIRFIRGYATEKDPIKTTTDRLEACLKWREEIGARDIKEKEFPKEDVFRQCWPVGIHGHGKMGRPIYIDRVGMIDPTHLIQEFSMEDITNFHVQTMERLNAEKHRISDEEGRLLYKHIAIIDLSGFGTKHMGSTARGPVQAMIDIDQHYYPESLYKMVIVNAPWVFRAFWTIVKPFIHPLTRERIKMGNHYLKEYIDEDQIPQFLGGKCKCEGGKCLAVPFRSGRDDEAEQEAANDAVDTAETT